MSSSGKPVEEFSVAYALRSTKVSQKLKLGLYHLLIKAVVIKMLKGLNIKYLKRSGSNGRNMWQEDIQRVITF